jgi:HK97 family phage portal protein
VSQEIIKLSLRDRLRGVVAITRKAWGSLSSGGWVSLIREPYTGAWQSNVTVSSTTAASNWAAFSCITLIANDIAKLPPGVMQYDQAAKIFRPVTKRRVLDIPNKYQIWTQFMRSWIFSLLTTGNTYVLRVLDSKGFVAALYVLDPRSVQPLVTPSGDVYYKLATDNLSGIQESVTVPASQIIHDRINTLFHPLCGLSPLFASGIAAMQGLAMQENSTKFFQNMSRPGGILTAPGTISDQSAAALKAYWEENFSGESAGKVAVVGDGLKYEALSVTAADSQLIEQLKFSGEMICATFHVPPYKLGLGQMPTVNNVAALNQQYYDQCLHPIVESAERLLDIGLDISFPDQIWFDTAELLRMDPTARWEAHTKKISSGAVKPNEVRREENLEPVEGGDTPYLQQQNYSLAELAQRADAAKKKADQDELVDVQSQAMNGAQVASLLSLVTAAANGEIPVDSAKASIGAAYPNLTEAQINGIVAPLANFEPTPAPAPAPSTPPAAEADDPEDPEDTSAEEEDAAAKELEEFMGKFLPELEEERVAV